MKIKPTGGNILIRPLEEAYSGLLVIPDIAKERPSQGIVVALGTGKKSKNGERLPWEVAVGDKVLLTKYGATEIESDGQEYRIADVDDVLAVLS